MIKIENSILKVGPKTIFGKKPNSWIKALYSILLEIPIFKAWTKDKLCNKVYYNSPYGLYNSNGPLIKIISNEYFNKKSKCKKLAKLMYYYLENKTYVSLKCDEVPGKYIDGFSWFRLDINDAKKEKNEYKQRIHLTSKRIIKLTRNHEYRLVIMGVLFSTFIYLIIEGIKWIYKSKFGCSVGFS